VHLLSLLAPRMFKLVRIYLIFFWGSGFVLALVSLVGFWFAPPVPEGPFADHPMLLRLLTTVIPLGVAGVFLFCLVRHLRMSPENMSAGHLQQLQLLQQLQSLSKPAEPIRKHDAPVSCPTCGAKFLLENSVTHSPPVCTFCGAHIPAST
jgi:hypothetical protein